MRATFSFPSRSARFLVVAFLAALLSGLKAEAAPTLYYNTLNGNLIINNDTPGAIINIKSQLGVLHAPSFPGGGIPAPAVVDNGDLPQFLAILNTPAGKFRLGAGTVTLAAPHSDLSFDWYASFGQPANTGIWLLPEPTSAGLAALGLAGLGAMRRRGSRRQVGH